MQALYLTTPLTHGKVVERFQKAVNSRLVRHHGAAYKIKVDGQYGSATRAAEEKVAWLLGVNTATATRYHVQNVILHPAIRRPAELAAGRRNEAEEIRRSKSGATGMLALAAKLAKEDIVENPPGSNTGGLIDVMESEVGIHAAPWCGAAYHYLARHGGGLTIDPAVRYVPSAVALAKAGQGGFKEWIPASRSKEAPAGSGVCYVEDGVFVHIECLVAATTVQVETYGGNTSPQAGSGSQADGGGFFHRTRPINGGGFNVGGFAVPYGLGS